MKYQHLSFKISFIILFIFFVSCKLNKVEEFEKIDSDNFSLIVPNDLERTDNLNELSKVQFQNQKEEIYFIVLEETKKGFEDSVKAKVYDTTTDLFGYFKVVTNHFNEITENFKVTDVGRTKIDSCNALIFSMTGKYQEDKVETYYRYALIEDDVNYYQIMSWTRISNKNKLIEKMDDIIHSFKRK